MRLLVAEDEKQLNRLITRTLEEAGYSVDSVFDGEAALDYLEAAEYDLAVLDIMMPKLDGIAVLKHYRSRGGKTPALFLTARDGIDDRVQGLDSGADDYIVKPFPLTSFLPVSGQWCAAVRPGLTMCSRRLTLCWICQATESPAADARSSSAQRNTRYLNT